MLRAFLLLALATPLAVVAQQPDTLRRALLVSYGSNLSFSSFNGGSVSLKTERSPTHALRFGLDIELTGLSQDDRSTSEDETSQMPGGFETTINDTDRSQRDNSFIRFDVVLEVERYAATAGRMRPYALFGVFGGPRYSRLDEEERQVSGNEQRPPNQPPFSDTQVTVNERTNKSHLWGGGFTGGLGVEWRVAGDLSLMAEYRTSLFFERSVNKNVSTRTTTFSNSVNTNTATTTSTDRSRYVSSNYGFRSMGLRVGAALYF